MPNADADSWGILLIWDALNRGMAHSDAQRKGTMDEIRKTAAERGRKMGLTYAGALLPADAHKLMQQGAKLVDVRTKPELLHAAKGPGSLASEWQPSPGTRQHPEVHRQPGVAGPRD